MKKDQNTYKQLFPSTLTGTVTKNILQSSLMYNGNCIFHVCLIKSVEICHSAIQFPFSHQLLGLAVDWKSFKCVNIEINDFVTSVKF